MKNQNSTSILDTALPDIKKDLAVLLNGNKKFEKSDYVKVFLKDFLNFYGNVYKTELRATPENIKSANEGTVPFTVNEKRNRTYINLNRERILDNIKNDILHALLDDDGEPINYEKLILEMIEYTDNVKEVLEHVTYQDSNFAGKGKEISKGKFLIYNVMHEDTDKYYYTSDNRGNVYKNVIKTKDTRKIMDNLFVTTLLKIKTNPVDIENILNVYAKSKQDLELGSVEENYQTFEFIELYKSMEFALKARYTEFKQKDFRDLIAATIKEHNPDIKEEELSKIASNILFKSTDSASKVLEDSVYTEENKTALKFIKNTLGDIMSKKLLAASVEEKDVQPIISLILNYSSKELSVYKEKYGEVISEIEITISREDYPLINRDIVSYIKKLYDFNYEPEKEELEKITNLYQIAGTIAGIKNNTISTLRKIGFKNWMEDLDFFKQTNERYGNLGALAHQFYYYTYQNNHEKILKLLKFNGYDNKKIIKINKILSDFIQKDGTFEYSEEKVEKIISILDSDYKELVEDIKIKIEEMKTIRYDNFLGEVTTVRNQISHENINLTKKDMLKLLSIIESVGPIDKVYKALQKTMYVVKSHMVKGVSPAQRYSTKYT